MTQTAAIPETMSVIAIDGGKGAPESLRLVTGTTPRPGPGQILVRVAAAGVSYPDIMQRKGTYPMPPGAPETLGLEIAGEVAALGDGTPRWHVGDRVFALLLGAGYAEYAIVDGRHALPVPAGLAMEEAAILPESLFTVFTNVFERGRLIRGETLLVHGGNSGIGVTAIALGKAAGARVIATSRNPEKARRATEIGADISIDSSTQDFVEIVRAAGGADVVLDMVGGSFVQKNLEVLNPEGRLCQIAFVTGAEVTLNLRVMLTKRLTFTASSLRARSNDEKARLAAAIEAKAWPWIASGTVRLPLDKVFSLADAARAHAYLESGTHVGKVALRVASS